MRWDRLFDDLEAQLAARARLELDAEVAERTRTERSKITLGERVVGATGSALVVRLRGGTVVRGVLEDSGDGWLLLVEPTGRQSLVATAAVLGISGLGRPRDDTRARRFGIASALRGISRDRRAVVVVDVDIDERLQAKRNTHTVRLFKRKRLFLKLGHGEDTAPLVGVRSTGL